MFAAVDATIWAAIIGGGITMALALLGVAYKLGVLTNTITNVVSALEDVKQDIKDIREADVRRMTPSWEPRRHDGKS